MDQCRTNNLKRLGGHYNFINERDKRHRLIVTHIGSDKGFLDGNLLIFLLKKQEDYHEEMNSIPNCVNIVINVYSNPSKNDSCFLPNQTTSKIKINR